MLERKGVFTKIKDRACQRITGANWKEPNGRSENNLDNRIHKVIWDYDPKDKTNPCESVRSK